jgi:hypothetical protein
VECGFVFVEKKWIFYDVDEEDEEDGTHCLVKTPFLQQKN